MRKLFFLSVFMLAVFTACGSDDGQNTSGEHQNISSDTSANTFAPIEFDHVAFERERELWQEQDIQNYCYALTHWGNLGPSRSTVYVKNGIAIYSCSDGLIMGYPDLPYYYPDNDSNAFFASYGLLVISISDIYSEIERFANSEGTLRLDVSYNSIAHYPVSVSISFRGNSKNITVYNLVLDPEYPE